MTKEKEDNNDRFIMKTVELHPVTVTAETLQRLTKEENNDRLIALYMSYVEVTTWQKDNSIKATTDFMANRLGWGEPTIRRYKKRLVKLGVIEDIQRRDKEKKITGHFILVKHVVVSRPHHSSSYGVVCDTPSANDFKKSANDSKSIVDLAEIKQVYLAWLKLTLIDKELRLRGTDDQRSSALKAAKSKYRFTTKRRDAIARRLDDFSKEELIQAIAAVSESEFHMGDNDNNWKATIEWLFKSTEKTEEWINRYEESS